MKPELEAICTKWDTSELPRNGAIRGAVDEAYQQARKEFGGFLVDHYNGMKQRNNPDKISLFAIILNYEMRFKVSGLHEQCFGEKP